MAWDREVDVVSVGSGLGGVSAALTVAESGGKALVLEKASGLGGVTGWSFGEAWTGPTSLSEAAGIKDSKEEALKYLEITGGGYCDVNMISAFLDGSRAAVDYFVGLGIELEVVRGFPDYFYPTLACAKPEGRMLEIKPFSLNQMGKHAARMLPSTIGYGTFTTDDMVKSGGDPMYIYAKAVERAQRNERVAGAGLMASFIHAAIGRGVEFLENSPAVKLVPGADGGVEGVIADTPQGRLRIRVRKGVVLATGGYDFNAKLMKQFEQTDEVAAMVPQTITGDHFALAGDLGGFIASSPPYLNSHPLGMKLPGEIDGMPIFHFQMPGQPHSILVNEKGERFADDCFYHDYDAELYRYDGRHHRRVNWPAWTIFDQTYRNSYPLGPYPPASPLPPGVVHTANSIEELASLAGIDPKGLRATVERFNGFCEKGVDEDFNRGEFPWGHVFIGDRRQQPNPNLGPIEKPPFYALKQYQLSISAMSAGLSTNQYAQVLTARDEPIKGLYAAGNAAARRDSVAYQSGIPVARGMAWGYVAARHMVSRA